MSEDIKLPYQDFYFGDWLTGTADLTHQQKGIYITLYALTGTRNGRGLPNDWDILCRMVNVYHEDLDKSEELKKDLQLILSNKFVLIDGNYQQQRQYEDRLKKVELIKLKKLAGSKGGVAKRKQNSSRVSESDSESLLTSIWDQLLVKRGSKQVALKSFINNALDIDPKILVEKYNSLCSQSDDPKFIPHFSTWLNQGRWEEELPTAKEEQIIFSAPKDYKNYVSFVKRCQHTTFIDKEMVDRMLKDGLITQEEHDRW